jgi:Rab GTPase-binding effector protein 1
MKELNSWQTKKTRAGAASPEEELKRAQDDSELLRSIVLPLEEQIVALKGKLRETDSLLQEYEKRQVGNFSLLT